MIVRTDTETALLAAIAKNPDEDDPRLRYSDWLEESGNSDRGEFIRVQCELSRHTTCPFTLMNTADLRHPRSNKRHMHERPPKAKEPCGWCPVCKNKERESALLAAHRDEWLRIDCPRCRDLRRGGMKITQCPKCGDGGGDIGRLVKLMRAGDSRSIDPYHFPATFARGFLHSVTARLADVFRQKIDHDNPGSSVWKPTALAMRWLKHHPTIRRVRLSDRIPARRMRLGGGEISYAWNPMVPALNPTDHSDWVPASVIVALPNVNRKTPERAVEDLEITVADVIRTHLEKEPERDDN